MINNNMLETKIIHPFFMTCLNEFTKEFARITSLLEKVVPEIGQFELSESLESNHNFDNEEVYSGLPTHQNSKLLIEILVKYTSDAINKAHDPSSTNRERLFLHELFAILSSTFHLRSTEVQLWHHLHTLTKSTGRLVDCAHALANQLLGELMLVEDGEGDGDCSKSTCDLLTSRWSQQQVDLFDSVDALIANSQVRTNQAWYQCMTIDMIKAYLHNYMDWPNFSQAMHAILSRFTVFLKAKTWLSVCALGYFYWFDLRARLVFGQGPTSSPQPSPQSPPSSILHAAGQVRSYGRSLVQSMCSSIGKTAGDKENYQPNDDGEGVDKAGAAKKTKPVGEKEELTKYLGCSNVSVDRLLALWLGTRLMVNGCEQLALCHTLLGSVREAFAFQEELLNISQRLHLPYYAQSALCMMAYHDMFGQRKYSFELRLRQLTHIVTSKVDLDEIVSNRRPVPAVAVNVDDESFVLHTTKASSDLAARRRKALQADPDAAVARTESIGPSSTNRQGSSPIRLAWNDLVDTESAFPNSSRLLKALTASGGKRRDAEYLGCLANRQCVDRILYGAVWSWLIDATQVVREQLVGRHHYLPVLIDNNCPPADNDQEAETADLVEAFAKLATPAKPARPIVTSSGSAAALKPPPAPSLNAPRRLASCSDELSGRVAKRRTTRSTGDQGFRKPVSRSHAKNQSSTINDKSRGGGGERLPLPHDFGLGLFPCTPVKPLKRPTAKEPLPIYIDDDCDENDDIDSTSRSYHNPRKNRHSSCPSPSSSNHLVVVDPVESFNDAIQPPLAHRSSRLTSRSAARFNQPTPSLMQSSRPAVNQDQPNHDLYRRVDAIYSRLSYLLPMPVLMRPICQWLALYWLAYDETETGQCQAGRFLSQSVGVSATVLYRSIVGSRLTDEQARADSSSRHARRLSRALSMATSVAAPNNPFTANGHAITPPPNHHSSAACILQLTLVDEFDTTTPDRVAGSLCKDSVSLGLGSRSNAFLVASRFTGLLNSVTGSTDDGASNSPLLTCETRVMHRFTEHGSRLLFAFDQIQAENLHTITISDRHQYWTSRYDVDHRFKNLLKDMRDNWFTQQDLDWLRTMPTRRSGDTKSSPTTIYPTSVVLILDRRLAYLPWEYIIWNGFADHQLPTITRSFSLSVIMGQLAYHLTPSSSQSNDDSRSSAQMDLRFDPSNTFFVLNPTANLPFTQNMFNPIFQKLTSWRGVVGRTPTVDEVNVGFTQHDLFLYLGHGSGSRFLYHAFSQGLQARAAILVLGCSSAKPRGTGRHEPYISVFNHLIAGCPLAAGILWDVTDRDMDRFTLAFLTSWLSKSKSSNKNRSSLGSCLFESIKACKLKHLVGKSVVVYGLPIEPLASSLLPEFGQ